MVSKGAEVIAATTWNPTNAEYHADRSAWSSSMIRKFRENGASWAHAAYVAKTIEMPKPTPDMVSGSAAHRMILEPERQGIVRVEVGARSAKAYKEAVAVAGPDELVLTDPEFDTAAGVAASILAQESPAAKLAHAALIGLEGQSEVSHAWDYRLPSGAIVRVKMRADRIIRTRDGRLMVPDLKTTADPGERFADMYYRYGYDIQAALYRAGVYNLTREEPIMACIAVRNGQPFDVCFGSLDIATLDLGRRRLEATLQQIHDCQTSGEWFAPWERGISTIAPPAWAEAAFARESSV